MIFIIVIAAAAALLGGTVAANWDKIIKALKGKKLAVLGERKVGKTSLLKFLTEGSIPEKYEATIEGGEKLCGRRFQLRDLELVIKDTRDVSGRRGYSWERITKDADVVLYLLRADRLMEGHKPTEDRVRGDIEQIKRWLDDKPKEFPLFLIGTHCDLTDPDLTTLPADKTGVYEDKMREKLQDIFLRGGGERNVRLVLGSLKSAATTEKLVFHLFKQIEEEREG